MKVKRKIVEIKEVQTEIITGIQCDECNCEIFPNEEYFSVFTGHRRWSHDSIDSHENLDICSLTCLTENMNKYYKDDCTGETNFYEIELEVCDVE